MFEYGAEDTRHPPPKGEALVAADARQLAQLYNRDMNYKQLVNTELQKLSNL